MQKFNYIGILLLAFVMLCGTGVAAASGNPAKAIEAAKAAQKKAASVSGEWRDTGKIIKAAQKALATGDAEGAIKLAEKARVQGERGYEQAVAQKDLRIPSFFK